MRKATKIIISFAVVLIAGLNLVIPAFAQDPFSSIAIGGFGGASGAGLFGSMAGMSGINISYTSDPVNDAMWNSLNSDSVYFSGEKHEASGQGEDIYDYINVDIGDWLQAQSDFIINFAQTHNVTDNSSGTVTTNKSYLGLPLDTNNKCVLGYVNGAGTYVFGGIVLTVRLNNGNYYCSGRGTDGSVSNEQNSWNNTNLAPFPWRVRLSVNSTAQGVNSWAIYVYRPRDNYWLTWSASSGPITVTPATNVPWTSDTVNTNVFNGWESAKVKIPHNISGLSTGWTIPDFMNVLDEIWYGHGEDNILIENGGDVPPVPPVPVPDTPLGEVPFDDWVDLWGQGIYQQLENQSDALDFIGSNGEDQIEELESIDSNLDDLNQKAESIDTNIGTGIGLLGGIKTGIETAVDYLEGIAEHVGELVEEIVEGTETLIAGILNQIPSVFGVIFGPIKQASSIWHYVVEWIQSISAPMYWIWSMASGTSYNIVLPVYASLAGAVVLAFYKRFGK